MTLDAETFAHRFFEEVTLPIEGGRKPPTKGDLETMMGLQLPTICAYAGEYLHTRTATQLNEMAPHLRDSLQNIAAASGADRAKKAHALIGELAAAQKSNGMGGTSHLLRTDATDAQKANNESMKDFAFYVSREKYCKPYGFDQYPPALCAVATDICWATGSPAKARWAVCKIMAESEILGPGQFDTPQFPYVRSDEAVGLRRPDRPYIPNPFKGEPSTGPYTPETRLKFAPIYGKNRMNDHILQALSRATPEQLAEINNPAHTRGWLHSFYLQLGKKSAVLHQYERGWFNRTNNIAETIGDLTGARDMVAKSHASIEEIKAQYWAGDYGDSSKPGNPKYQNGHIMLEIPGHGIAHYQVDPISLHPMRMHGLPPGVQWLRPGQSATIDGKTVRNSFASFHALTWTDKHHHRFFFDLREGVNAEIAMSSIRHTNWVIYQNDYVPNAPLRNGPWLDDAESAHVFVNSDLHSKTQSYLKIIGRENEQWTPVPNPPPLPAIDSRKAAPPASHPDPVPTPKPPAPHAEAAAARADHPPVPDDHKVHAPMHKVPPPRAHTESADHANHSPARDDRKVHSPVPKAPKKPPASPADRDGHTPGHDDHKTRPVHKTLTADPSGKPLDASVHRHGREAHDTHPGSSPRTPHANARPATTPPGPHHDAKPVKTIIHHNAEAPRHPAPPRQHRPNPDTAPQRTAKRLWARSLRRGTNLPIPPRGWRYPGWSTLPR